MTDQLLIALLGTAFVLAVCLLVYAATTSEQRLPRRRGRHRDR